jgi:hypothetical protein
VSEDEHESGCECAACDTLVMRADEAWTPTLITDGQVGRCVFCRRVGPLDHYTQLGMTVGRCCARL